LKTRVSRRIAQAVVDRINAAGIGITARREYPQQLEYEHLSTLRCSVAPLRFSITSLTREKNDWLRIIAVTLSKRLEDQNPDRVDDQGDLIEAITELWADPDNREVILDSEVNATCIELEVDSYLDSDDVRESHIARTQLLLTFRSVY
jgi:hypothetical protein